MRAIENLGIKLTVYHASIDKELLITPGSACFINFSFLFRVSLCSRADFIVVFLA